MRALVSHSGLQHSHQVAWALEEVGALTAFVSGVPVSSSRRIARTLGLRYAPIPAWKRVHIPPLAWAQRHIPRHLSGELQHQLAHAIDNVFDRLVAELIPWFRPDAVICFENAAEHSFAAARAIGARRILHAASLHFLTQRSWLELHDSRSLTWTEARKQRELDAADLVITCSELAMQTFVDGGVSPSKLRALPLGTDLPEARPSPKSIAGSPLRVVFLGTVRRLKGVDLLLDASAHLRRSGYEVEVTLVGSPVESDLVERARGMVGVRVLGAMSQAEAFREVARHDLLVLPSRLDSFGMVVPEAMALGLPCVVSTRAGARCIVEEHPDAGWLVEPTAESIYTTLAAIVRSRGVLETGSVAALQAAQKYSWQECRARLRAAMLARPASSQDRSP